MNDRNRHDIQRPCGTSEFTGWVRFSGFPREINQQKGGLFRAFGVGQVGTIKSSLSSPQHPPQAVCGFVFRS
jgi:hypothetical protein